MKAGTGKKRRPSAKDGEAQREAHRARLGRTGWGPGRTFAALLPVAPSEALSETETATRDVSNVSVGPPCFFLLTVISSLGSKPVLDLVCTLGRMPGEKCGEDKCDSDGLVCGVALLSLYIRSVHKVMPSFPGT